MTDGRTGKQMVIERKSVVWPPTYVLQHQNGHEFAETIWQSTKDRFQDSCYELRVSGKELNKLDRGTVRRFASETRVSTKDQNSDFQCFQQLQGLPWDCQTLENTHKTERSWVISVGDSTRRELAPTISSVISSFLPVV
jgi:hypothetical protein